MNFYRTLLFLTCFSVASISASATEEAKNTNDNSASQTLSEQELQNTAQKMNVYIDCFNQNEHISRSIERYASWIDDFEVGPTGKESLVYGLYNVDLDPVEKCLNEVTTATQMAPKLLPVDEEALKYVTTQHAVAQIIDTIYPYYENEDYKDDEFTKGKEIHPEFATKIFAFYDALEALSDSLNEYNNQRQTEELKLIEKTEGRQDAYYNLALLMEADKVFSLVGEDKFDPEAASAAIDQFSTLLDEAEKYINSDERKSDPFSATKRLVSEAKDFNKTAKDRYRHMRDNKQFSDTEKSWLGTSSGWMVKGSPDVILKHYNQMVNLYNR